MIRLINLNRFSRTKIEENENGYRILEADFPYSFEDMIFEDNIYVIIHKRFCEPLYTYLVLNMLFCICNNVSTKCTSSLHNK